MKPSASPLTLLSSVLGVALAAGSASATEIAMETGTRTTFLYFVPATAPTLGVAASAPLGDVPSGGVGEELVLRADVAVGGLRLPDDYYGDFEFDPGAGVTYVGNTSNVQTMLPSEAKVINIV